MKFNCWECGACCKLIGETVTMARKLVEANPDQPGNILEVANFPHNTKADGSCEHLVDNKCSIYETRPDICKVDVTYLKYHKDKMTQDQYFVATESACKILEARFKV